ncbi:MAG: hypothetical protein K8S16_09120 [Bacteroidales bacterium]|nr:hypothetical protein [Bacteroidales bacterium]
MNEQTINQEFNNYFQLLSQSQKESILSMIKSFLNQPERISLEQYNKEISKVEESIEKGNYLSQDDLEKVSKEW